MRGLSAGDLKLEVDGREVPIEISPRSRRAIRRRRPLPRQPDRRGGAAAPAAPPLHRGGACWSSSTRPSRSPSSAIAVQAIEGTGAAGSGGRWPSWGSRRTTIGGRLDVLSDWTGVREDPRRRPWRRRASGRASGNDRLATRRSWRATAALAGTSAGGPGCPTATISGKCTGATDSVTAMGRSGYCGSAPLVLAQQAGAGSHGHDGTAWRRRLAGGLCSSSSAAGPRCAPTPASDRGQPDRLYGLSRGHGGMDAGGHRQRRQPPHLADTTASSSS